MVEVGELVKAIFGKEDECVEVLVQGGDGWKSKGLD